MKSFTQAFDRRPAGAILFVAFFLLWAALTKVHTHSWQEESRMATVQALVEQATFAIDHTAFNRTGDKVFFNGHFYSDKTPLLSVAAAGIYAVLHNAFGLTLDPAICVPDEDASACRAFGPNGPRLTAFYWLTLICVGAPSALLVALFWKAMVEHGVSGLAAIGLAVALGLASPIAPYSIVFAGHVPAALCLFAGFALLTRLNTHLVSIASSVQASGMNGGQPRASMLRRFKFYAFGSGLLISLAANIDLTLAVFLIAFGLWLLIARRDGILPFALGAAAPFAASAAVNYWAVGSIIPLYFDPGAYDFLGAVLNKTVGGTSGFYSLEFGLRYMYEMFVGGRGVFAFTPLLVVGVIGALRVIRGGLPSHAVGGGLPSHAVGGGLPIARSLTAAMMFGCLAFALYLIVRTDNFGGAAWGTRWFVPLTPLLWYYLPYAFKALPAAPRSHAVWSAAIAVALILSLLNAAAGLHDAWRSVPPILRL